GVNHRLERLRIALEVRDQQLDPAARRVTPDRPYSGREGARPAIGEIVAIDGGDHRVLEAELTHRAAHALRLLAILPHRLAVRDRAIAAVPRAGVTEDHEGGRGVFPALADVRTVCFLAHRVQIPLAHEALEPDVARAPGRAHLEPCRLGRGHGPRRLEEGKRKSHGDLSFFPAGLRSLWHSFHKRNRPRRTIRCPESEQAGYRPEGMVPKGGLEPPRVAPHAPQTCASANSATSAQRRQSMPCPRAACQSAAE